MSRVKILRASAGSGKTYRLAYEYIKAVVVEPRSYVSILAVTFTNKATEEMKSRIIAELNSLANGKSPYLSDLLNDTNIPQNKIIENAAKARSLILHDYSHFAISTIDKFFQKIVRGFIKELGLDFGYTVELSNDSFLAEAVDRLIEKTLTDKELTTLVERVLNENLENAKSWDIRPELVRIGEQITKESYKQLTINHKQLIDQYELIAENVNQKIENFDAKRGEVLRLMEQYNLQPSDFSGGSRSFAFYFVKPIDNIRIEQLIKVMDNADAWFSKSSKNKITEIIPRLMELTREVVELYESLEIEKNSFELLSENFNKSLLLNHIATELEQLWGERNRLPIHQTTKLIGTLIENTAVPFIYEKAGNRFDKYMIDEFQDTSSGQWANFVPLLDDAIAHSNEERVMLIGDVKQAIYRWRGGDWDILARGASAHYGDDADTTEQLSTNWRSLPVVVDFNNRLMRNIVDNCEYKIAQHVYDNFEQITPSHKKGGYVEVAAVADDDLENRVLETVQDAIERGYRQRDIAILVRRRKDGQRAADILLKGGYNIIDQESLLLSKSTVVSRIVSLIRYALNREDIVSLAQYNRLSNNELTTNFENVELLDEIVMKTPIEALDTIIRGLDLEQEEVSYLQAFYQVVMSYCAENVPDLPAFIEWWDENSHKKSVYLPSSGNAITILTIHKSKGLQFPCVIIPMCSWELEPIRRGSKYTTVWATTDEPTYSLFNPIPVTYKSQMELSHYVYDYHREKIYSFIDAINMLYVAVTRAERELYIFHSDAQAKNDIYTLIGDNGEFGEKETFTPKEDEHESVSIHFDRFRVGESMHKIRTSWDSQRYYEDGGRIETPISTGVLMHQLFSKIRTEKDIDSAIENMVINGDLTPQTAKEIRDKIETAFENPTIKSWFIGEYELYNENAILIPNSSSTKRPDRVLVNGKQAIVVDYKFGKTKKSSYAAQIDEYKSLLMKMGYDDIHGYLWYVELNEIVEC